jgi:ribonuclease-3
MDEHDVKRLEKRLGYRFRDRGLLELALTHSSATVRALTDNERLEFLGDAVLGLIVSERMFRDLPQLDEGQLTRHRSSIVSTVTLSRCAKRLRLEEVAILGRGIQANALPPSVRANLMESLIAAVYLDGGMEAAQDVVHRTLEPDYQCIIEGDGENNYKSILQQHTQRELGEPPQYRLLRETGPDHGKTFLVSAVVGDVAYPPGSGPNKKTAEQQAALRALCCMGIDIPNETERP